VFVKTLFFPFFSLSPSGFVCFPVLTVVIYDLNMKCLPQAHVLHPLASGTIWGGSGNFRRWDLAGGSRSLGTGHLGMSSPSPFPLPLCFLSSKKRRAASTTLSCCHDILLKYMVPRKGGPSPLSFPQSFLPFSCFCQVFWSQR
jgi:hypothetical protein